MQFVRLRRLLAGAAVLAALLLAGGVPEASGTGKVDSTSTLWNRFLTSLTGRYSGRTLHVVMINDPFISAFGRTAAEFTALTGARVRIDAYSYDQTYAKEVLACEQHSSTFDLIIFDLPWMEKFVPCVDPLDPYIARADPRLLQYSDFFPVMRQGASWNGKVYGFPFAPYFVIQHYNTRYYSLLGLKPARTLDQFVQNARAATGSKKLPAVYGTALNNQAGSVLGQAFFEYIYNIPGGKPFASEYPGSARPYADMTPMFASPEGLAVAELFKRLLPDEPPGALSISWPIRQSYFDTGRVAAVNQWDVSTPSVSDPSQSTIGRDYATAPFPSNGKLVTQVGGWTMGINSHGTQKDLVWSFVQWFTSAAVSVQFAKVGGFPARTSALSNPELIDQYPWYDTLKQVIPTAYADCRPRIAQSFDIIDTLGLYLAKALAGSMTPRAALLAADHDVGLMLRHAGYTVRSLTD